MSEWNTWIIEPRDPLIVRDGRPFGPNPGARATSLAFPFPSTTTGGARTRAGLGPDGAFDRSNIPQVRQLAVRGPMLVKLADSSSVPTIDSWLAPAPADALLLAPGAEGDNQVRRLWLAPRTTWASAHTDLPEGLIPVAPQQYDPQKPFGKPPRFWFWQALNDWLVSPQDGDVLLRDLGLSGPQQDYRAHVSIRPDVQTAEDGALFATTGLEFTDEGLERLAVAISVEHQDHLAPVPGTAPLGGERRLVRWHHSTQEFPACPPELIEKIIQAKACRVLLLTPASFSKGWLPEWLLTGDLTEHTGVIVRLSGAALGRWQVVSGWDLERSEAKPTRRLVPAGSVFFLKLAGTEQAIGDWVTRVWMQCVSDTANDRNDGFGLAVVGTWPDSFSNGEAK